MSKAREENKLTIEIKRPLWEFDLYCKLMRADENNDKNKKNIPRSPLTQVIIFLIAEKLLSLRLWNFQAFILFLWTVLGKNECNCMRGLLFYCRFVGGGLKNKHFFSFMISLPSQKELKYCQLYILR